MRKKALAAAALAIIISMAACGSAGTGPSGQAVKAASETVAESTAQTASLQKTAADDAGTVSGGITEFTYRDMIRTLGYDPDDYVELNDYKKLDLGEVIDSEKMEVTDEEVEAYIKDSLFSSPAYEKTDKDTVGTGDIVGIDYTGKIDGAAIGQGTYKNVYLKIGEGIFFEDFENGLIGAQAGETVTLSVDVPEDYRASDLAGKTINYEIKVNGIYKEKRIAQDTMTDEDAAGFGDYASVADFKKDMRRIVETNTMNTVRANISSALESALLDSCQVKLPKKMKADLPGRDNLLKELDASCKDAGMGESEYIDGLGYDTLDEYLEEKYEEIENEKKLELIRQAIVKHERYSMPADKLGEALQIIEREDAQDNEQFLASGGTDGFLSRLCMSYAMDDLVTEYTKKYYSVPEKKGSH